MENVENLKSDAQVAVIMVEIKNIKDILAEIKEELKLGKQQFATSERVSRLEKVVYGGAGLILAGVITSALSLLLR